MIPPSQRPFRLKSADELKALVKELHRHGIEPDNPSGLPFDPHRHEAVNIRFDPAQADHLVLDVLRRDDGAGERLARARETRVGDVHGMRAGGFTFRWFTA